MIYPEFMPPTAVLPTSDSPSYITESNPEYDPKEDDEDPEEDPADYPTNKDDDKEEEEEESSRDDPDDKEEDEGKDEEEEEHLAPPDFSEAEVDRLLAISTPPPSPLTSYSSPLPQIPSPPLLVSSPLPISPPPLPTSPTHPLGYRAAMIWLRAESPSTSHLLPLPLPIVLLHTRASMAMMRDATPSTYILVPRSEIPSSGTPPLLPIPLPTSLPPLLLPSTDYRADVLEVTLPPRKRLCIAPGPRYEVKECSSAPTARPTGGFRADYGFVGTLDAKIRRDLDREIGYGIIDDDRLLMSGQLNLLRRDRRSYACTVRIMEGEAKASCEAWVQSMDASDTASYETTGIARRGTDPTEEIADSDGSTTESFVSTAFSSQIDITPTTLDHYYDVELADGRIIGFDAIIGMDWLAKYQVVIVCAENIVCIPWGNKTLIFHGDRSDRGNETHLNIISCTKTQKYMLKGCHVFLAHVTTKKTEDKSEGK
ncbi:putative reverse transcriptase domain-containing protein [Tanacetum coccineum]